MKTLINIFKRLSTKVQKHPSVALCLIIMLLGCTIYLCLRINSLSRLIPDAPIPEVVINTSNGEVQTQTSLVANQNPFKPTPSFSQQLLPNKITYWDTETILPEKAEVVKPDSSDTIQHSSFDLSSYYYRDFLSNLTVPQSWQRSSDSLVQMLATRKKLTFTTINPAVGKFSTQDYDVDFERYKYNWQPSTGLTREKNTYLSIQPFVQARYQPFHQNISLGTGISFKTRKLDYNLGVYLNRDARVNPQIYPDVEFSVTFYPTKWQK